MINAMLAKSENEHEILERAERGFRWASGSPQASEQVCACILAGFCDGYTNGVLAAVEWLRVREYEAEAEALEKSLPNFKRSAS